MAYTRRTFLHSAWALLLAWLSSRVGAAALLASGPLALAIRQETGGLLPTDSESIRLEAPEIAEDGALVPISVESSLPEVGGIWVFVEKNPTPLAAHFSFEASVEAFVSLRIKMNESCEVVAVVQSGGEFFCARKTVRVVLGGCG